MFACDECTKGKRKCNKQSPRCERCVRLNKPCTYPTIHPRFRNLESKISKIEDEYKMIKSYICGNKMDLYSHLISAYISSFTNFLPFISSNKLNSIPHSDYNKSALINSICIQPYKSIIFDKKEDLEYYSLLENPFYIKTEELLMELLEDFSLETIQVLLILSLMECSEGLLSKATLHLAQAIKKSQVKDLNKAVFKRLSDDSDLQAEYIATWSMCVFIDSLASNFYSTPSLVHTTEDFENVEMALNEDRFIIPYFENLESENTLELRPKDMQGFINLIRTHLDLQFRYEQSELFLISLVYEKMALLSFYGFWLRRQLIKGYIDKEKFLSRLLKSLKLFQTMIPPWIKETILNEPKLLSYSTSCFYYHLWIVVDQLQIFPLRNFKLLFPDPDMFDDKVNALFQDAYKILDSEVTELLGKASMFLGMVSFMTIYFMADKPHFAHKPTLNTAHSIVYKAINHYPLLFNLLQLRNNCDLNSVKKNFPDIEKCPLVYKYFK